MIDYNSYLVGLIQEYLTSTQLNKLGDLPLTGFDGIRRQLGELNMEFFARAYFPEYFRYPIPKFHKDAYEELSRLVSTSPATSRKVRIWPRGFAKSTIYNFFTPTNVALYGKRNFTVVCSDTETQAQGFLADIKNALANNPYILEDFGDVCGEVWRADMISIKCANKLVWIGAVGAGSGIRGLRKAENRPDLIIVDDLESDDSVLTLERINKLHTWFQRALLNLGNEFTDVIVVGTVLAYDCVLDRLMRSHSWEVIKYEAISKWSQSPLWDEWTKLYTDLMFSKAERERNAEDFYNAHKSEMLENTEVLWADGKSYLMLMKTFTDIGDVAFWAEYQNDPIAPSESSFNPEWFQYYLPEEIPHVRMVEYVAALDPSLGRSRLGDYTAFITLGRGNDGFIYVVDAVIERLTPDKTIDLIIAKAKCYSYSRIGIETNQFQELLRLQLMREGVQHNVRLPLVELPNTRDKVIRVQSLVPHIKNGYIKFKRDHTLLMYQLQRFPTKKVKDDGPDCLEMAYRMVVRGQAEEPMLAGYISARHAKEYDAIMQYTEGFYDLA